MGTMTYPHYRVQQGRMIVARQHYHFDLHSSVAVSGNGTDEVIATRLEIGYLDSSINTWDAPNIQRFFCNIASFISLFINLY